MLALEVALLSDKGGRHYNEDACGHWHSSDQLCCVLADGAGGHGGGDIASRLAVQELIGRFAQAPTHDGQALGALLRQTNDALIGQRVPGTARADMHSTAVCLVVDFVGHQVHWAHAGDSRMYWFREGRLLQRTRDHSLVQSLVDAGMLPEQQISSHPQRSELRWALPTTSSRSATAMAWPRCRRAMSFCCAPMACGSTCPTPRWKRCCKPRPPRGSGWTRCRPRSCVLPATRAAMTTSAPWWCGRAPPEQPVQPLPHRLSTGMGGCQPAAEAGFSGLMKCSFGMAPSTFVATPKMVQTSYMDAGNIMDNVPMMNVPPFGMCQSLANPTVAAATAAAMGALTPMPCIPVLPAPWVPGAPTVLVSNMPALNDSSMLMCAWAGVIQFSMAGQTTEMVP